MIINQETKTGYGIKNTQTNKYMWVWEGKPFYGDLITAYMFGEHHNAVAMLNLFHDRGKLNKCDCEIVKLARTTMEIKDD